MRIAIASDPRGVLIKAKLVTALLSDGHVVEDLGTNNEQSVDYPDYAKSVSELVSTGKVDRGILICGTGMGMAITANKFPGVRAASCHDEIMAEMSRRHNDVKFLCLPGDMIGNRPVADMVRIWLATEFDGGRHQKRIDKIAEIEGEV